MHKCTDCGTDKLTTKLFELNSMKLNDKHKRFMAKQWQNKKEKIGKRKT